MENLIVKYFLNPDLKVGFPTKVKPVFKQGLCEDSSQDSKRTLFLFLCVQTRFIFLQS